MTTIDSSMMPAIFSIPQSEALGTGATERGFSLKSLAQTKTKSDGGGNTEGLISHAAQHAGGAKAGPAGQPALRAPQSGALSGPELERAFESKLEDPAFAAGPGQLLGVAAGPQAPAPQAPAPDASASQSALQSGSQPGNAAFNIMTMSFSPADLIIALVHLLGDSRTITAKFNSEMTLKGAASIEKKADSIKRDGLGQMGIGIAQGVVSFSGAVGGAALKVAGQRKDRLNTKLNLEPAKNNQTEMKGLTGALNGSGAGGGVKLADADRALIGGKLNSNDATLAAGKLAASDSNRQRVSKLTAGGDAAAGAGSASGTLIGGIGSVLSANEQAGQKLNELDSRVTGQSADNESERRKAFDSLLNDMLQLMAAANQSRNAAVGAVAGNIRG